MSEHKISSLLALSLLAAPLSLPATTSWQESVSGSSIASSQRASARRMKHLLMAAPVLQPMGVYRAQEGFANLDLARQSQIDSNERDHCTSCKAREAAETRETQFRSSEQVSECEPARRGRFGEVAASQNSQNLTERGIYVGQLHEKWQFPSDHLPIGMTFEDLHILSWNVLDAEYMSWVTEKDSQGLKDSLITKEHVYIGDSKLTVRDRHVVLLILGAISHPTHPRSILALQECGKPFLEELRSRLPAHFELISHHGEAVLLDTRRFNVIEAKEASGIFSDAPNRTLQDVRLCRLEDGQTLRLINAHLPGDPEKPGRLEFARYLERTFDPTIRTLAMGDMNFNEREISEALTAAFPSTCPFSLHSPYPTNISPFEFNSKAIDHFIVYSPGQSAPLLNAPEQIMRGVDSMAALLQGKRKSARVLKSTYCSDDLNGEMLYKLDNGMLLSFRWYADPRLSVGEEISWVKEGNGIRIFYEGGSSWLRGDFEMNCFTMP